MKIAVCVPHTGTLKAETAQSLGGLLVATAKAEFDYNGSPDKAEIDLLFSDAGPLDWKRTNLAMTALRQGSDYLLWVDSDQTFGSDALIRLMMHDKPIVAGNYPSRLGGQPTALSADGVPLGRGTGLESAGAVGFGFCLMKTPILRQIAQPWFANTFAPDGRLTCGEDVHFCNQARLSGIPIYVDHDLDIGHIADRVLKLEREGPDASSVLSQAGAQ